MDQAASTTPADAAGGAVDSRSMAKLLVLAAVMGVLAAAAGSIFLLVIDRGQELFFKTIPESAGWSQEPWWWVTFLLLVGAAGVALARRLPGATGNGPLTGFHFDDPLSMVPSVLIAALFTLVFGFVLGPEAPLIVLGTAVGAIVTRKADPQTRKVAMLLGGVAAIGAVLGNPFITGFMILEFAAMGLVPAVILPAVFIALGTGFLTQIGMFGLPGFGLHSLSVPGLPAYTEILPGDLAFGFLVAVVAAVVAVAARETAVLVDRVAVRRAVPVLFAVAIVTALIVVIAQGGFDIDVSQILFSGNAGMSELIQQTSVSVVIVILVGKALAYAVALGGGFRGGPIFPATFLGVAAAVLVTLLIPDASITPLAAAGIAASAGAMLKLPATSALLGAVLVSGGGADVAPFAIFGAIVGLIVRLAVDKRLGVRAAAGATTPTQASSSAQPTG